MQEFEIDDQGILTKYNGNSEHVKIPENVICIGERAFDRCARLKKIHLPNRLEMIGEEAFMICGLEEISIPDSVYYIGSGVFQGCRSLRSVKLPSKMIVIPERMFGGCNSLLEISIPETVIGIEYYAFHYCNALKELQIPDDLKYIHPEAMGYRLTPLQIIYQEIQFSTIAEYGATGGNKAVNYSNVINMIKEYHFDYSVQAYEKIRVLMQLLQKTPEDSRLINYFRTGFPELAKSVIDTNFMECMQKILSVEMIQKEHIDELIRYATDQGKPEMQVMLLNYKREHFGFESIEDKAKKLLL